MRQNRGTAALLLALAGACGGATGNGPDANADAAGCATAVGVGTATFLDPRATLRIVDELRAWCARNNIVRARELTGGLHA